MTTLVHIAMGITMAIIIFGWLAWTGLGHI